MAKHNERHEILLAQPEEVSDANENPLSADMPDTKSWVTQAQGGFAPYYTPRTGDVFVATPIDIDTRNPKFPRFLFSASHEMSCAKGPKKAVQAVTVRAGEDFSMSAYAALPVEDFLGIETRITIGEKIDIAGGHTLWQFELAVSPEDSAALEAQRVKNLANRAADAKARAKELGASLRSARAAMKAMSGGQAPQLPARA